MTDLRDVMSVPFDGRQISADEMREFLAALESHFKLTDSSAYASELLGVMSVHDGLDQLDSDDKAEAMRCGFRLALYLAQFDFPLVQKAIRQQQQRKSTESKRKRVEDRNDAIIARYKALLETEPEHTIADILAVEFEMKRDRVGRIIRPHRMK